MRRRRKARTCTTLWHRLRMRWKRECMCMHIHCCGRVGIHPKLPQSLEFYCGLRLVDGGFAISNSQSNDSKSTPCICSFKAPVALVTDGNFTIAMCRDEKTLRLSLAYPSNGEMTQQMMIVHALVRSQGHKVTNFISNGLHRWCISARPWSTQCLTDMEMRM